MKTERKTDNRIKVFGVFASWNIEFYHDVPYVADMHYAYIEYLCANYPKVVVVSSSKDVEQEPHLVNLSHHQNLKIVRLPYCPSYISSMRHLKVILCTVLNVIKEVDVMYSRVPDPLCWCPSLLSKKPVIMDFIGDTIDATWHNEKWSLLKKCLMITGYLPEYILTLIAAKKCCRVVTAGFKLSKGLTKWGIKAKPLIPSLINGEDIPDKLRDLNLNGKVKLAYIGYIRYAKGITTLMNICTLLQKKKISFELNVIGVGEMLPELEDFVALNKMSNVHLLGFVEKRDDLNNMVYNSDILVFPSLSEGAPRVVIEAMSLGTPVVATPVGALPYTFKDKESIRFFDFNDADAAVNIIEEFISDPQPFVKQRDFAYKLIKNNYTKDKFFEQVYSL